MASTSSLEFFGLTLSCCWIGLSCEACGFSDCGCDFAGSGAGGGLCANTVPPAKVARIPNRSALPRVMFMMVLLSAGLLRVYTHYRGDGAWFRPCNYDVMPSRKVSRRTCRQFDRRLDPLRFDLRPCPYGIILRPLITCGL